MAKKESYDRNGDISKDESLDRYNAEKSRRAKAGRIQAVSCSAALWTDTVVSGIFYLTCAVSPLVFTFLSKPDFSAGGAAYTPATVESAEPDELFAITASLFVVFAVKLVLAVCSSAACALKKGIRPMLGSAAAVSGFIDLIFSAITLTYPESYTQPVFTAFMAVNILLAVLCAVCVYIVTARREIREYENSPR